MIHIGTGKKKTHEEYVKEIAIKRPYIKILGTYIDSVTKLEVLNENCGHIYSQVPASISRGYGCPICNNPRTARHPISHEEFMEKFEKLNSDFIILDEYKGVKYPLKVKCRYCGKESVFDTRYLLAGKKCNDCNGIHKHFSPEAAYQTISEQYEILSEFSKATDRIDVKCRVCGSIYNRKVGPLYYTPTKGCLNCSVKRTHAAAALGNDGYQKRLDELNTHIIVVDDYIEADTPIKHKCLVCGKYFKTRPGSILYCGSRCPHCQRSKGETRVAKYLDDHGIRYQPQKKYPSLKGVGGKALRFDFYLNDYDLLIEYQGQFHDGITNDFAKKCSEKTIQNDEIKRQYVKEHNLDLLEIWYWDFENIEMILERELNKFPILLLKKEE